MPNEKRKQKFEKKNLKVFKRKSMVEKLFTLIIAHNSSG